jgi:hypothetical protein
MSMGLTYLNEKSFVSMKSFFIDEKRDFEEVRTSNSRFLQIGKSKYYLSSNVKKDSATQLKLHELKLLQDVKKEMLSNYEKVGPFQDVRDMKLYIGSKMDLDKSFDTEDIWEVDMTAAYPTQAKILGLISQDSFDKFFEVESDRMHVQRKRKIREKYSDGSYFSGGGCLRYSKKCRLISLGSLATKKEITYYKSGLYSHEETIYDGEQANIFYTLAFEVGRTMMDIAKDIEGVYFWWVDAIFCTGKAKDKVVDSLQSKGYGVKVNKLECISFDSRSKKAEIVKDNTGEIHPYFFSSRISLDSHTRIMKTSDDVDSLIEWYKQYLDFPTLSRKRIRDYVLEKYGEVTVEKVIFTELCDNLRITDPNELNTRYLIKILRERGLCMSDFIQIRSISKRMCKLSILDEMFGDDEGVYDLLTVNSIVRAYLPNLDYSPTTVVELETSPKYGEMEVTTTTRNALDTLHVEKMSII